MSSNNNLKLKRVGNALHIINGDSVGTMPLTTSVEIHKAIDTMAEVVYQVTTANQELKKSVNSTDLVEEYSLSSIQSLFDDVTLNIPSHICADLTKALQNVPQHLQGQALKALATLTARVYSDAAEQILLADDTRLLSKSLAKKAVTIGKDVELVSAKLDEPLEKIKKVRYENAIRKDLLKKGVAQGELIAKTKYAGITADTLETAAAITKAKRVTADSKEKLAKSIRHANYVAE